MRILAGDVGGTNTRLALYEVADGRLRAVEQAVYPSRNFAALEEIVRLFLSERKIAPNGAAFGVAGPVRDGRCEVTKLPWTVDARKLAVVADLRSAGLINDLEANAYGITELAETDLVMVNPGAPGARGNAAIISAGTGLGEAGMYWDGTVRRPFATEGGHASFSPADAVQAELLVFLLRSHEHVSWDIVLSGPGLCEIYRFLRETGRGAESDRLRSELAGGDPAAVITRAALEGREALCVQTLDLFVSLYGSEAGNLALKVMATGGVYVGGGIAPRIREKLSGPLFMRAFTAKGRMTSLLADIPVCVILNDKTALLGAGRYAFLHSAP
ncbi:MAG: glucokinase [Nitrospirae bacterium]|nr:glucokinase [Nitrospirota bacterium]